MLPCVEGYLPRGLSRIHGGASRSLLQHTVEERGDEVRSLADQDRIVVEIDLS